MTNKQMLAALREALECSQVIVTPETRYMTLRTSVKSLVAALEVSVKDVEGKV